MDKKVMKAVKNWEKTLNKLKYEWAAKRGRKYPLSLADLERYQQENHIQQQFCEMKDILIKGNKRPKSIASGNIASKLWPLWSYDDVASDDKLYQLMTKAEMDEAVSKIEGKVHCSISCYTPGYIELSLSLKSQCCEESGLEFAFDRASIMVSPSQNISKHLYIGADEEIKATFYAGYDIDDEDEDAWSLPMIGFLVFTDKDDQNHAVKLQEFSALVEVKEGEAYIFTFYSKTGNMLLIKHLSSLDVEDLFADCDDIR